MEIKTKTYITLTILLMLITTNVSALQNETTVLDQTILTPPDNLSTTIYRNLTNGTSVSTLPVIEITTTTTSTTDSTTTTTTLPEPLCGNSLQEVGEECDTSPEPCGAGNWACKKCKCVTVVASANENPLLNLTVTQFSNIIPKETAQTFSSNNTEIFILIIVVIAVISLLYKLTKKSKGEKNV